MKVKKVELRNGYKRFHHLTIDLGEKPKKIIALVGANGCGKSSVLDGMLYLSSSHARIGNKGQKDHKYHSMNQTPNYNHSNVTIEFETGSFPDVYGQKNLLGLQATLFSFRSPYRYNSDLMVTQSTALNEIRQNNYGASTSSDLDDKMEQSYRRLYIKYNRYLNDENCRPSEAKEKIIGDLNEALKNCLDIEITSIGNIESSEGTLYFKKPDHPSEFGFNVLSSGEKEVVDILLDLYLRQDVYNDTVFLIDEPELHLNTSIQKSLLIEINKLVGNNCQIWVATHSIGFLRALQDELKEECQIIYFPKNPDRARAPETLLPIPKTRSNWQMIFETALDDLTGLISPKRIIYCEGRDQPGADGAERGLDAKVYNKIFSEKHHDTLFISSGGNTELDQRSAIAISILSKVFSDVEILVLKDRDMASGQDTSEAGRQIYLENNPSNHRVLRRWEIENYLYDKEVLRGYCTQNGLVFNENEYDRFVTDISNQNLKDETGRIKSICGITSSINTAKFKENLSEFITEGLDVFLDLEESIFYENR
jgi:predicted ATPase